MSRFCPYCGTQYNERSKFCPRCGKVRKQGGVETVSPSAPKAVPDLLDKMNRAAEKRTVLRDSVGAGNGGRTVRVEPPPARAEGVKPTPAVPASQRRFAPPTHIFIGTYEQAGFGLRYGAWMFDFLITLIAIMSFTFVITAVGHRSVVDSNDNLLIVAGLTMLLIVLNFVVLAGRSGQSAGMRILGIQIAREDGKPFTMKHAALRHLVGYPLSMAGFFLGFLWMLWDPRQQGWHDKLAGTIVVVSK